MVKDTKAENQPDFDKGLVSVFLRIQQRSGCRQRLPMLEQTLRQVDEEYGTNQDSPKEIGSDQ